MSRTWCPYCEAQHPAATLDSRTAKGSRRRRKVCSNCRRKFTTIEVSYPGFARGSGYEKLVKLANNIDASTAKLQAAISLIRDVIESP